MAFQHKVVIRAHRPWRRSAVIVGVAFAIAVGAWLLYSYTRANTVTGFAEARSDRDRLQDENDRLQRELRAARSEAAKYHDEANYAQKSQEIDAQSYADVKSSLSELQAQAADLREQLAFYRGIVSPQEASVGVRVYDFKVASTAVAGSYRYDFVLIQSLHHEQRVNGQIEVVLEGLSAGVAQSLKFAELITGDNKNLLFSFKYFEEFSGDFHLPDGFRPLRAKVALIPEGSGQTRVEDQFDWTRIVQKTD